MLEFYSINNPKAKKLYVCDLCGDRIGIGEKYVRNSGKLHGEMFDYKYHTGCHDIIETYCLEVADDEYDLESVHNWIREEICPKCCSEDDIDDCFCNTCRCKKTLSKIPKGVYRNE